MGSAPYGHFPKNRQNLLQKSDSKLIYGICGKLKSCRSLSLLSMANRIRSIRHLYKKLWQKIETMQDVSISGFFQFWLERISFFPFLFSNIFDIFNASKTMLQLILTLGLSWLHVCMISLMVLIFYKRKIYVMSIFWKIFQTHIFMCN